MLAGQQAWVTGLRRGQSNARGEVPFHDRDDAGRLKLNPLADWSWADVWHYIATHQVPTNRCTTSSCPASAAHPAPAPSPWAEDFRAGRWWWKTNR